MPLAARLALLIGMAIGSATLAVLSPALPQSEPAQNTGTGACTLIVHVTGFRNHKGKAGGTVFSSADGWPENNNKSLAHGGFPIDGDHATLTFHLPAGRYAVAVLHDENMNHKLDRNFLGIPKEGFGFANNPHVGLKAPDWNTAAVNVACPVTEINVRLIYK